MPDASAPVLVTNVDSPIGRLTLMSRSGHLTHLDMEDQAHATPTPPGSVSDDGAFTEVVSQLGEYFAGKRTSFDVPMALEGTDFQLRVWSQLCSIPFGETISYGELARRVGQREQPDRHLRALPPGHRRRRFAGWLRRRARPQGGPPGSGAVRAELIPEWHPRGPP